MVTAAPWRRILRHWATTRAAVRRAFPSAVLARIEAAIRAAEVRHAGELRFVVEAALDGLPLLRGQDARERAVQLFSQLRVWDTEDNCGVLIYLLMADRRVEIVVDRGILARAGAARWEAICRRMEHSFALGDFERGVVEGIDGAAAQLALHAPAPVARPDELPDAPVLM